MKLAKIALPVAILSLAGLIITFLSVGKLAKVPEGDEALGFGLSLFFIYGLFGAPITIAFIVAGVILFICEICLFLVPNKRTALTVAIVFMCIILIVVFVVSLYILNGFAAYSKLLTALTIICDIFYLGSLVTVFIARSRITA